MVWDKLWRGADEVFIEIVNREKKEKGASLNRRCLFCLGPPSLKLPKGKPSFASSYAEVTEDKKATEG
jgi:hypothetical protein